MGHKVCVPVRGEANGKAEGEDLGVAVSQYEALTILHMGYCDGGYAPIGRMPGCMISLIIHCGVLE